MNGCSLRRNTEKSYKKFGDATKFKEEIETKRYDAKNALWQTPRHTSMKLSERMRNF
ncbi:MAG: hypothetical protein LBM19_04500 [Holosporales bacterium]|nr:hypothetical protein [Holosporales bacterium]